MNRGNTPWRPAPSATLAWHDETPYSTLHEDFYYSSADGLSESEYVFLQGNDLPARWGSHNHPYFCIAETGFGTGLNFLATWQAWRAQPEPRPDLHYIAIDSHPLYRADIQRALSHWPALQSLAPILLEHYPDAVPGQHRVLLDGGRVRLDLWWEDAPACLADLASSEQTLVDAWYLDGFTPTRNTGMWTSQLFRAMAALSRPAATFATFTAAGQVRREMSTAGFDVAKRPGFGVKRECCHGVLRTDPTGRPHLPNEDITIRWDLSELVSPRPDDVLVIGAGLAGCHAAAALARRGIAVTVLEQHTLAGEGSANEQGVLYTRLSLQHSPLLDFALESYQFATRFYSAMFANGQLAVGAHGELCGTFAQHANSEELGTMAERLAPLSGLAQVLSIEQANEKLGVAQTMGGYWYPRSGWLSPPAVCTALLDHPKITLQENVGQIKLEYENGNWLAQANGKSAATAPCVIIATGNSTVNLAGLEWLPIRPVRGQTTAVPSDSELKNLKAVLCHKGYIAPHQDHSHCIGATFDPKDSSSEVREEDHAFNLKTLAQAVPGWKKNLDSLSVSKLAGRTRFRCASADYLPLVGAVPNRDGFISQYQGLRRNAQQTQQRSEEYLPGLYLTTGHGSRGLTSTPLAAEILASNICQEPAPVCRELTRAVNPARFIIRDLIRNRI